MTEPSPEPSNGLRRIDAHHHLWDLEVRDQDWTRDLPAIRRSFSFDELRPHLADHRITGTVLVQTVAVAEETPELLALAAVTPEILGVVGWVDLTAADVADRLAGLREGPGGDLLVGIRHLVQSEPDPEWLLRDDVLRGLTAVADAGLVYDLLVRQPQLPAAVGAVEQVPDGRWVLDHVGKPVIDPAAFDEWAGHVAALARHDSVACKLSGLVTELAPEQPIEAVLPWAAHVIDVFGAERTMIGSDWPVCLLRSSYDEVVDLADTVLAGLDDTGRADVWGGTAARVYGLDP
ncbi:amidohydrolase family protein [Nocardioides sp. NPDC101246]|uniref:amidohydrolase family protein n=1 Tax=Nocardioides sp. NPDC101246 TaxID=3364336 RepID=UPI0037FB2D40